ncbi:MAG: hypothetical protein AVO35_09740 [Candidatus Aegiribacteria sp. MLS_C]|nr:MAG: hypothetical protein AVO35_09740 [Candidatus Aegiribacteria sp. MLS_C]
MAAGNPAVSLVLCAVGRRDRLLGILFSFAFQEFTIPLSGASPAGWIRSLLRTLPCSGTVAVQLLDSDGEVRSDHRGL